MRAYIFTFLFMSAVYPHGASAQISESQNPLLAQADDETPAPIKKKKKKKKKAAAEAGADGAKEGADSTSESDSTGGDGATAGSAVADYTSAGRRAAKPVGLAVVLAPLSDFFFQGGLAGMYSTSSRLEFFGQILAGSKDLSSSLSGTDSIEITKADVSSSQVAGGARFYLGNSFNFMGGLGYRTGSVDLGIKQKSTSGDREVAASVKANGVVTVLALGNHWTLGGFTIGADWLAVSVPLTKSTSFSVSGTGLSASEMDDIEKITSDLADKIAGVSAVSLCNIQIGFRF